eukprot:5910749-Pyramimonas_sp.AAC.1
MRTGYLRSGACPAEQVVLPHSAEIREVSVDVVVCVLRFRSTERRPSCIATHDKVMGDKVRRGKANSIHLPSLN